MASLPERLPRAVPRMAAPLLERSHREALSLLGWFYLRHGRADRAFVVFRALTELFPADATLQRSLAAAALGIGEDGVALEAADRHLAMTAEPETNPVRLVRSRALWRLGHEGEARAELEAWLAARRAR